MPKNNMRSIFIQLQRIPQRLILYFFVTALNVYSGFQYQVIG